MQRIVLVLLVALLCSQPAAAGPAGEEDGAGEAYVLPPGRSCARGGPCEAQESEISEPVSYQDQMMLVQGDVSTATGVAVDKSFQDWEAHAFDPHSEQIAEANAKMNETALLEEAHELAKRRGCVDDPLWRDADGDGCEIYKFAITSGKTSVQVACHGGGVVDATAATAGSLRGSRRPVRVVADTTAKVYCRATCQMC
ncbi:unnamed protein product [Prorocentrum cordatum]|uniref:Subtilisin n=1 Tax=Prorocentrum cordatum TaxID=2364126 RepID=A0ABN9YGB4_9DINO|nr:unnamed protein product [Polarella glacialis]